MATRLNGLCAGGSGAGEAVALTLAAMLNAGVHPVVPRYGSIGASDLCLLAHVGLVVAGEGEADYDGRRLPGGEALAAAGIAPARLQLKDGLALCNASSVTAAAAALAIARGRRLLEWAQSAVALSMEGFRASLTPIDPRVVSARPAPGQDVGGGRPAGAAGRRLADRAGRGPAAAGSDQLPLRGPAARGAARRLRRSSRPPSSRSSAAPPTTRWCWPPTTRSCPPATSTRRRSHWPPTASRSRSRRWRRRPPSGSAGSAPPSLSGLPANLTSRPAGSAGMAPLQKPAQALVAGIRHAAAPLSIGSGVNAESVEDDATNSALAVLRLSGQLDLLGRLLALELVVAAQAVDLAAPARLGRDTQAVHALVRERVQPLDDDRPLGVDIERVAEMLA